jgi:uncharacterized protein YndB with AHSA1/START domain
MTDQKKMDLEKMDVEKEARAIERAVGQRTMPAGEARTVLLQRTYDAPVEDVWDAITDPQRIARWFLPVTGDLRLGGTYQLEGNAGGKVLRCEPPHTFTVTWAMGEDTGASQVEVRLSPGADGRTLLRLDHSAVVPPEMWEEYGPGAVGVGWDLGLLGLGLHLQDPSAAKPEDAETSPAARAFITLSSAAWGAAYGAAGAGSDQVEKVVANTTAFYAPEPDAPEPGVPDADVAKPAGATSS